MAELLLGPLLRYVSDTEATIWVETDSACEVEVLGHRTPTFHVEGHHYALVRIDGLEPGTTNEYSVALDGETRWPEPDSAFPPSVIRTLDGGRRVELVFGSCRVSAPHDPPYTLPRDEDERGREIDALYALVERMRHEPSSTWPDLLLLLGDQIYADEVSLGTEEFIRSRRDPAEPPGTEVADFEEYTHLYWDSWREPHLRWLLSTVSSAMIFDDHDVHDDWNTSNAWVAEMRAQPWWQERILGGFMSYWIYQHLGNLSPREIEEDGLLERVAAAEDAGTILREHGYRADRESVGVRWSYHRDLGGTRLVMIDSRAGRVLDDGRRSMVDDDEWAWIERTATGDFDHLLLGTSLPVLLARGMHNAEAWNEAVCDGAWGRLAARAGEWIRQAADLEHWAAFHRSFRRMTGLLRAVGAGERGNPPASIVALSGDVHHAYLAEVAFRRNARVRSAVYQATCSPVRNPLGAAERRLLRTAASRPVATVARALARAAGVEEPDIRWRYAHGPWFNNQIATLELNGRAAVLRHEKSLPGDGGAGPRLEPLFERRIA